MKSPEQQTFHLFPEKPLTPLPHLRRKLVDRQEELAKQIERISGGVCRSFMHGPLYVSVNAPQEFMLTYPLEPNSAFSEHLTFTSRRLISNGDHNQSVFELSTLIGTERRVLKPSAMKRHELDKVLDCFSAIGQKLSEYSPRNN